MSTMLTRPRDLKSKAEGPWKGQGRQREEEEDPGEEEWHLERLLLLEAAAVAIWSAEPLELAGAFGCLGVDRDVEVLKDLDLHPHRLQRGQASLC